MSDSGFPFVSVGDEFDERSISNSYQQEISWLCFYRQGYFLQNLGNFLVKTCLCKDNNTAINNESGGNNDDDDDDDDNVQI